MVTKKDSGEVYAMKVLKKQGIRVKKQKVHLQGREREGLIQLSETSWRQ